MIELTDLLDDLIAKKGRDYYAEFVALMTALIDEQDDVRAALLAPLTGSSTTSASIGTGAKTLTLSGSDEKAFVLGQRITAAASVSNYMIGVVSAYNSGTRVLSFTVEDTDDYVGSGTHIAWTVSLSGDEGPRGPAYWNAARVVTNSDSPVTAVDSDIIMVRTSTGAVQVNLPADGKVKIIDVDGASETNNITVNPAATDSIMDGVADEDFIADINFFSADFIRRPSGTNWSVC
ncbi:MAG: hypothetical protein AB7I36_08225 [Rhodospirillaceae bacterium]